MKDHTEIGAAVPRRRSRLLRAIGYGVLRVFGWRIDVCMPNEPKLVVIAAPHTSNWDFVFGMATILALDLDLHWFAKHSLFSGIWGRPLRAIGGIPIDRSAPGGVVRQTAQAFENKNQLIIGLAPEGTRARVAQWKRGFYHLAMSAQVPVLIAWIDYRTKTVGADLVFRPTGDWDADMQPVFARYRRVGARKPENFATG
ncbi:1-acyl-sn-glycerol-3-phosphate acyltransferase [Solimonas terrae]|uniref:Glycerol acyltransferase n=1 Tax=Solimonas terrae TaxID=1396819 RepID=A0A6M2BNK7_9GAMM|nr:1-acyl-sn-glycerol-3-phosphate acyltransferase [Solimonas terrae]NGY03649.1 glycerol acyltransferase [Solimonas terrae]